MVAAQGWPLRAGRNALGTQDMQDERLTVDPTKEIDAQVMNLLFHQVGALGLISPKAVMLFKGDPEDQPSFKFYFARFAWDDVAYDNVLYANFPPYLNVTHEATGQYRFDFAPTVPGIDGSEVLLEVKGVIAKPVSIDGNVANNQRGHAEIITESPASFRTLTRKPLAQFAVATEFPVFVVMF